MDQNLKLLRQLRYCILAHLVISTLTIVLWVITVVFFLKEYASFTVTVDSFELFLYILNICTVIYLLIFILIYKPHVVVKNRATSIIECAVWSIATLVVFYAMKLGIEKSLDLVLFYLDPASEVRHYENVLFISVTVFPLFLFAFIINQSLYAVLKHKKTRQLTGFIFKNPNLVWSVISTQSHQNQLPDSHPCCNQLNHSQNRTD